MPIYRDESGRAAGKRTLRIRGAALAAVLTATGTLLYQQAQGTFDDTFALTVVANSIGEGLAPGAEVKFHGLNIGSVKSLKSAGYMRQVMTVVLDPTQAKSLTSDTKAQFTSSNVFGTSAVELVSSGKGAPLAPGQVLEIGADARSASITGLLRQAQKFGAILDSADVRRIIEMFKKHAGLTEPVATSLFDFAKILADSQTVPFSQSLSVIASVVNGGNDLIPLFKLLNQLLDKLQFLVEPGGAAKTNEILEQVSQLLHGAGDIFGRNGSWLAPLTRGLMNVAVPGMYSLGSLAPAYDRISGLLDRTNSAFPIVDGQVRMRVDVLMDTMPGLPAALPTAQTPAQAGAR